jgi:ActR/RegA family two-component response regulator
MNRVLLIVDDTAEVARGLRRCLKHDIGIIRCAHSPEEAEKLLQEWPAPTHVLCDENLGEGSEKGSVLIRRWREQFQSIRRAGLLTGGEPKALAVGGGVDRVFAKPVNLDEVRGFLSS